VSGVATMKVAELLVPPPGDGFTTVTTFGPTKSVTVCDIEAVTRLLLTNAVV